MWWLKLTCCHFIVVSIDWARSCGCQVRVPGAGGGWGWTCKVTYSLVSATTWLPGLPDCMVDLDESNTSRDSWLAQKECSKRPGRKLIGFLRSSFRSHVASFPTPNSIGQTESQAQSRFLGRGESLHLSLGRAAKNLQPFFL